MRALSLALLCTAALAASGHCAVPTGFYDRTAVSGLNEPVGLALVPDGRLFCVEQRTGKVRMVVSGHLASTDPVLTVGNLFTGDKEAGLLGIAVDPGWPSRPYIYVYYNCASTPRSKRVSRFTLSGDLADPLGESVVGNPASRYDVIADLPDTVHHHNGGTLRFGNDGKLYLSVGDEEVEWCLAQDTSAAVGRILRFDVSGLPAGPGGPPDKSLITPAGNPFAGPTDYARLTWALGLRNPFRFHVDSGTGSLFIADVGEITFEEIDYAPAGGLNFGWPFREGNGPGPIWLPCDGYTQNPASYTDPILSLDRTHQPAAALISAGRYRTPATSTTATFPASYDGDVFYSDYYMGYLRRLRFNGSGWPAPPPAPGQPDPDDWGTGFTQVSDYVEGPDGALWYVRGFDDAFDPSSGTIGRIARDTLSLVAVEDAPGGGPLLDAPRPNPTREAADVSFRLNEAARVDLTVLDVTGRVVWRLVADQPLSAGVHSARWDGRDEAGHAVPSGLYFLRLRAGSRRALGRIALLR